MTVKEALAGSGLAACDAEVLLAGCLGKERTWLLQHGEDSLSANAWETFACWAERRRSHEPVAYIIGRQEFYGRQFIVDRRVLIPRPATEGIVLRTLQFLNDGQDVVDEVDDGIVVCSKTLRILCRSQKRLRHRTWRMLGCIVDVGTGSGCIAVTLACELPRMKVIATDISADALDVACVNAERHGVRDRITFMQGNGLEPISDLKEAFLLVGNPPYIPTGRSLMEDVQDYEPHVALFGGTGGDEVVKEFIHAADMHPMCVGWVMEMANVQSPGHVEAMRA